MNNVADTTYLNELWEHTLLLIQEKMSERTFDAMFAQTHIVGYDPTTKLVSVGVPTMFTQNFLREHYTAIVEGALTALTEREFSVEFVSSAQSVAVKSTKSLLAASIEPSTAELPDYAKEPLIDRYKFDSFVIGSSNRFAHAACLAVAENPGKSYNPLFIYGGVGLGKTHLMHAIGHAVRQRNPYSRVLYLTTERFINDFIMAIRDNSFESFRNRYRSIDVLLIDDIQFIAKKEQTQEEFFHTFNALHQSGKQIVISSDRPPREIPTLEDRLRSRFEWGLLTDIQPPDLETRIAILQRKAKADGILLAEDVYYFIANQIDSNIRELEGALIRIIAYSSLVNEDITLDLAERALKDVMIPNRERTITINQIQKVIGDHFGIRLDELKAKNRTRPVAFARQVAMFLSRELTNLSLPKIGESFGGRDHTTVMHACDRIHEEMVKDPDLRVTIQRLTEAIRTLY
jgi:chromosomal replication initiator protein